MMGRPAGDVSLNISQTGHLWCVDMFSTLRDHRRAMKGKEAASMPKAVQLAQSRNPTRGSHRLSTGECVSRPYFAATPEEDEDDVVVVEKDGVAEISGLRYRGGGSDEAIGRRWWVEEG